MRTMGRRLSLTSVAVALALGLAACHGQSSGVIPSSSTAQAVAPSTSMTQAVTPQAAIPFDENEHGIRSSCGRHINIVVAGILDCRFHELGYGNGVFTISNHYSGIFTITPSSGTRATTFTALGVLVGSGYFTVTDTRGHRAKITVSVTP
jgi:hypothetical protein